MAAQVDGSNGVSQQSTGVDSAMVELSRQLSNLRNNIVAGTHPQIKVPKHLINGIASSNDEASAVTLPVSSLANGVNLHSVASNALFNSVGTKVPPIQQLSESAPASSGNDTASSTLPQAKTVTDIRQKRQLLERALEEQLKNKKVMAKQKTCDQEIVADFDVGEVLRKAHELVKPFKPREINAANRAASSSDSFDENTFYSSQMNDSTTTEEADNSRNWRRPLRACRFFRDGKPCPYGEKCTFSHDPAVVRQLEADEQQRAGVANISRANEQASRRNNSSPQPLTRLLAANSVVNDGSAQDQQTARIAELEDQLRRMKEQQRKNVVVPRAVTREDRQNQEQSVYTPPEADEFGRDTNMRNMETRRPRLLRLPSPPQVPHSAREYHVRNENPISPLHNNVPVVRNHITSPYAPQPARVSPLAVTKLPQVLQVQHNHTENRISRGSNAEVLSAGQSPNIGTQPVSSKKRRRRPDMEDQGRNVAPRRGNAGSPTVRIKEEPVSPPSYSDASVRLTRHAPEQLRSTYMETVVPRPQERIIYRPAEVEDEAQAYDVQERRPMTPTARRVISRNGQHYFANEEIDLRRVVSARHMRAPPSPGAYDVQYSDPQPRTLRGASQVQYVSPAERAAPAQYRASVQPQARERLQSPQPRQLPMSPTRRTSLAMPPPSRRIVVDQFGNRFMEASIPAERAASVVPPRRQVEVDDNYEEATPRRAVIRQSQPVMVDERDQYIRPSGSPTSPQYIEYPTVARRRQLVELNHDPYGGQSRVVYEPRSVARYQDVDNMRDSTIGMESVRPVEASYEVMPQEQISRVSSVRPQQPRIVSLGEHREMTPRVIRQVSVRPDEGFAKPVPRVQRMQDDPMYQYASREEESRYVEIS
ncbi:MAG: hypothetical protein Q9217_004879 [Psora testacea]